MATKCPKCDFHNPDDTFLKFSHPRRASLQEAHGAGEVRMGAF